jgi:hypothetical protein
VTTIDLSSTGIARLNDTDIIATDPTTGQPVTLEQIRALDDNEWGAWRDLDNAAYLAAYAVHVRGDWAPIEQARRDRHNAARRAATLADMEARAEALRIAEAAKPKPEPTTFDLEGPTVEVTLPPRFYEDHVARGCHPGEVVRTLKTTVRVRLDAAAFDDLMSDARYYSDAADFDPYMIGLVSSARATVKRLTAVKRPA